MKTTFNYNDFEEGQRIEMYKNLHLFKDCFNRNCFERNYEEVYRNTITRLSKYLSTGIVIYKKLCPIHEFKIEMALDEKDQQPLKTKDEAIFRNHGRLTLHKGEFFLI